MLIKRREFLQTGALASASLLLPKFLKAFERPGIVPAGNKVLVMLQLSGGNDGLNTVAPTRNDIYYRERPGLAIRHGEALRLDDACGLHPALSGLKNLYDNGDLAILNNVGYPNPDRSHFRSMDIWHSASPASEYWQTGWIGRYLDAQCSGCARPTGALEIDDTLSLALKGEYVKGLALQDPGRLYATAGSPYFKDYIAASYVAPDPEEPGKRHFGTAGGVDLSVHEAEAPVEYLYKTMAETLSSAEYLHGLAGKSRAGTGYPDSQLGKNFKTIASLILADAETKIYYLSHGSFDTHINQNGQQQRLFQEMNAAIEAFAADMKAQGRWEDVVLVTFSEFGRRVAQNASGGTDHGTANNMFFMGGALRRPGLLNELPDLGDLDAGDLKYRVDFRQVYATLLQRWLQADPAAVLGQTFDLMDFV